MQNFTLNIKQSAPIKPIEDAAKSSINGNKLNQNPSNAQENSSTQNSFQSLLNKQVQAKRTQENMAAQKPAVKTTTKNPEQQPEKNSVSASENLTEKKLSDEDENTALENLSTQLNEVPREKYVGAEIVTKEEDKRKIAEDAEILAAIMQDVNSFSGQPVLDPAVLIKASAQGIDQVKANQDIVNQLAVKPDAQDKSLDSLSEALMPTTKGGVTSNFSSSLLASQVKPALDNASQTVETNAKASFSIKDALSSKLSSRDAQLGEDKSAQNIIALNSDSLKSLENKENLLKGYLTQSEDKDLNVVSVAQSIQQANLPSNTAVNAAAQLASNNQILAPFGKTGWDQAISQKVVWMVGAGEQSATLTLNPPDLGPVQVVISVNNDKADTTFISDNADVRQALQDGLEHLREKMEASGIQLGDANVNSGQQSQQSFQEAAAQKFSGQAKSSMLNHQPTPQTPIMTRESNGLVDTFA